ncbi:MAG: molybdopterin-dependent oxidoreductase [Candidatus Binataceae bacterium]
MRGAGFGLSLTLLLLITAGAASAIAGEVAPTRNVPEIATLRVVGVVPHPLTLQLYDLEKLPARTVTAKDASGVKVKYRGVTLWSILNRAGVPRRERIRGAMMLDYVVVDALDGYRVVFSLAELDPKLSKLVVLLAYKRNGQAIPPPEGPFRIVIPSEKYNARWVREVTVLDVRKAR